MLRTLSRVVATDQLSGPPPRPFWLIFGSFCILPESLSLVVSCTEGAQEV